MAARVVAAAVATTGVTMVAEEREGVARAEAATEATKAVAAVMVVVAPRVVVGKVVVGR